MSQSIPRGESRGRHPSARRSAPQRFAHPSERLFAHLLTLYGHDWIYEPFEFPLAWGEDGVATRGFRPDFYLPSERLFIELTVCDQRLVTKKNQKIRRFRTLFPEVALLVVYRRDFHALLDQHDLPNLEDRAA